METARARDTPGSARFRDGSRRLRPGVLLDVDGTLVDSNYLHTLAWSRAFREAGEWVPMNAIHRLIGMGSDRLVREVLGRDCPSATAARPRQYQALIGEVRVFPRAGDLLRELHRRGLTVVLATSAAADELAPLREALDAEEAIAAQTTADDIAAAKPAPDIFLTAMRIASIDPLRAVALGDSVWDIRAAQAAGIRCLAVETGGFSEPELSRAGALQVYRDVQELLEHIADSPLSGLTPHRP